MLFELVPYMWLIYAFVGIFLIAPFLFFSLRTRRFYIVRHGETLMNAQHLRQGPDGTLSEKGRHQAQRVGDYLKPFHINRIISSSYQRAEETASIIAAELGKTSFKTSSLLIERRNPSEIVGKSTHDPKVVHIVDQIDLAYHKDSYRFSDEENFVELKRRAKKAIRLLRHQYAHNTVIVTHHVFLKMLVAYMLYHKHLTAAEFTKLQFFNFSSNASITFCEYHPWQRFSSTRGWKIISYDKKPDKEFV